MQQKRVQKKQYYITILRLSRQKRVTKKNVTIFIHFIHLNIASGNQNLYTLSRHFECKQKRG